MAAKVNLPRLVQEIQDVTTQLFEEFTGVGDPITDDNHVLHRLCVKLEYLLQSCMREKSILGGTKSYWHWMYDSLKRTKGLSDGLKFVRANKEVRTSQGRGRALVRYSLVHQTLADSFQNCLMNKVTCLQYLKPNSILMNPTYATSFVNALYELNAVHFDLISKGYDLDSAWPTFASKRYPATADQWRAPGRSSSMGSLNSLVSHVTATSIVMDTPQLRGFHGGGSFIGFGGSAGSNGPPSVDQRVEELVLELDQSDQKIKEQQEALSRLENDATNLAKSATEKQDILARVISDLESRNQTLQDAMSSMSTEFQNREQSWKVKHEEVSDQLNNVSAVNVELKSRVSVLEEDKRNLEDTVSARMSRITSGFSGTNHSFQAAGTPTEDANFYSCEINEQSMRDKLEEYKKDKFILERQVDALRVELASVPKKIESEKQALKSSLKAKFESKEFESSQRMENAILEESRRLALKLSSIVPGSQSALSQQSPQEQVDHLISELAEMANEFSNLRRTSSALQREQLKQRSYEEQQEFKASELMEKYNAMLTSRDEAVAEADHLNTELVTANKKLQNYKLKLEAALSDHQHSVVEFKDKNFQLQEKVNAENLLRLKATEDVKHLENELEHTASDAKLWQQKYEKLREEVNLHERESQERAELVQSEMGEKVEGDGLASELQEKLAISETERTQFEDEVKHLSMQVENLEEKNKNSEDLLESLQLQIEDLKAKLTLFEKQKESAVADLLLEKVKSSEQLEQMHLEFSSSQKMKEESLENIEKQYRLLAGNLAEKEKELTASSFQMNAMKACMEEDLAKLKKDYEELVGENESRKRMIKSFENKLKTAEKENRDLSDKNRKFHRLEEELQNAKEKNKELMSSTTAIEEEFIGVAQKLEDERDEARKLKDQISEGTSREDNLKSEINDLNCVVSELKMKLIQLLQEKDALWKECDELRYLQKLQEEGERTEGKWMEDQEARYCLHCGTEFSFIVRKHHCRTCGKIFCSSCSKQWILTKNDGKHERCCLSCLERHRARNEMQALASATHPKDDAPKSKDQQDELRKQEEDSVDDLNYETITDEELQDATGMKTTYEGRKESKSSFDDSIYATPNAKMDAAVNVARSSNSSLPFVGIDGLKVEEDNKEAVIAAGEALRVPVRIEEPGTSLFWRFSTDRSIDFQLSYSVSEGDDEQYLIPKCRCNSHSEPVEGEIVSKKPGVYILEFDNKFSRFNSKAVKYTLRKKDQVAN